MKTPSGAIIQTGTVRSTQFGVHQMTRLLAGIAIGLFGGYLITKAFEKKRPTVTDAERAEGPPAYRIAGDIVNMCDTMRPILITFRESLEDRTLSPTELYSLYQQVNRLT